MPDVSFATLDNVVFMMPAAIHQQNEQAAVAAATTAKDAEIQRLTETMNQAASTIEQQRLAIVEMEAKNRQQSDMLKQAAAIHQEKDAEIKRVHEEYDALHDGLADILGVPAGGDLFAAVKKLVAGTPPVVPVPPVDPKPVPDGMKPIITKERFENLIIGCIVKVDDAGTEDVMVREIIDKAVELGCNSVTAWFHPSEVETYLKPENVNNPAKNIFKYASDRGVIIGADTIDAALRIIPETTTDEVLNKYVDGLIALGAKYVLWNDVDGLKDGKRVYTPEAIHAGMARIRRALKEHPNIPVIASLTAGANLNDYRTVYGFDMVEIQTDGSLPELDNFMKLNADIFALFVEQDKSLDYLKNARSIVVNSTAKAIRIYSIYDGDTDFRKPKLEARGIEVKETIRQYKVARKPVKA